jgi:hypothetical protein
MRELRTLKRNPKRRESRPRVVNHSRSASKLNLDPPLGECGLSATTQRNTSSKALVRSKVTLLAPYIDQNDFERSGSSLNNLEKNASSRRGLRPRKRKHHRDVLRVRRNTPLLSEDPPCNMEDKVHEYRGPTGTGCTCFTRVHWTRKALLQSPCTQRHLPGLHQKMFGVVNQYSSQLKTLGKALSKTSRKMILLKGFVAGIWLFKPDIDRKNVPAKLDHFSNGWCSLRVRPTNKMILFLRALAMRAPSRISSIWGPARQALRKPPSLMVAFGLKDNLCWPKPRKE